MSTDIRHLAPNIREREKGWFEAIGSQDVSYPADGNDDYFRIELESFWFRHRNNIIVDAIRTWSPEGLLVDVGGGNGYVTFAIQEAGYGVALLEAGSNGVRNARMRGVRCVVHAAWEQAGFLPDTIGAVGLFDVLEHVADDIGFLRSLWTALAPGGLLYLTVPAHAWLWSGEDVHAGHFRRYAKSNLVERVTESGFELERMTHFFSFLAGPMFIARTLRDHLQGPRNFRQQAQAEHRPPGGLAQILVSRLCAAERALLARGWELTVGSSLLLVARKC